MLAAAVGAAPPAAAEEVAGPIRFVPEAGSSVRIEGRFAARPEECPANQPRNLHAAYPGILEVGRRADGRLYLVTELTFPDYLLGIDEMPRSWPLEALKAQVVAARTYAVSHMNPSTSLARELNFNLCATDACQVYRGLKVERGPWGDAWAQAVRETAGEILEHGGEPASTFYYSTSNGRTYTNAEAFGGSPLPYLRSVREADDGESPLSVWTVRMPLSDLAGSLQRAESWDPGPLEEVVQEGSSVRLSGGGQSRSLSIADLRARLNKEAVCLVPKRYPTPGSSGRALPQVIPSKWMEVRREGSDAVFQGRGWGHGVGMVQWGAHGKAERGMPYDEILAFYYGGLRPVRRPEPGRIRVGLAVGIEELQVEHVGTVRVEGAAVPTGPLAVRGGPSISIEPGPPPAPELRLEGVSSTGAAAPAGPAGFSFELSAAATVSLLYRGPPGVAGSTTSEPRDRGLQTLAWDAAASLPGGDYEVSVVAESGVDRVVSDPVAVTVTAPAPSPPAPSPSATALSRTRPGAVNGTVLAAAASLIGAMLVAVAVTAAVRTRRGSGG